MNSRAIAAIARKDTTDAIRNRYLLIALLTPLFVALLFRLVVPGIGSRPGALTLVVHDSGASNLVAALRGLPQISLIEVSAADGLSNEARKNHAVGALDIPAGFDAKVAAGQQPELVIYLNTQKATLNKRPCGG